MDLRARYCASLGGPLLEGPIPTEVNQAGNNQYFEQQSHIKGQIRKLITVPQSKTIQ
jgi:hypothetical protein